MNIQECDIMKILLEAPFTSQRALAEQSGHALGIVNRSLKALIREGYLDDTMQLTLRAEELRRVSFLQHPQQVMALFPLPEGSENTDILKRKVFSLSASNLFLALDGVQDPGNLGTIIRIADWFGISTLFCSHDTADAYNPKVVQATMGSIARVKVIYTNLLALFEQLPEGMPVYGTFLDGKNIYQQPLTPNGIIVMGNEGKGISKEVAAHINHHLLIPSYPAGRVTADSLNVAIATAITCAEFRRK